jgi:hypothetical protein
VVKNGQFVSKRACIDWERARSGELHKTKSNLTSAGLYSVFTAKITTRCQNGYEKGSDSPSHNTAAVLLTDSIRYMTFYEPKEEWLSYKTLNSKSLDLRGRLRKTVLSLTIGILRL